MKQSKTKPKQKHTALELNRLTQGILALPLIPCKSVVKSLNLSGLQFFSSTKWDKITYSTYFTYATSTHLG